MVEKDDPAQIRFVIVKAVVLFIHERIVKGDISVLLFAACEK